MAMACALALTLGPFLRAVAREATATTAPKVRAENLRSDFRGKTWFFWINLFFFDIVFWDKFDQFVLEHACVHLLFYCLIISCFF